MSKFLHLIKLMLVTGFVTGIFQNLNAQQVLKRIETNENNEIIATLYACANGTNNINVQGDKSIDIGSSQGNFGTLIYDESSGLIYGQLDDGIAEPFSIEETENISNATLEFPFDGEVIFFNSLQNLEFGLSIPIATAQYSIYATIDETDSPKVAKDKLILPNTLNDGQPIPDGIWFILMSRDLSLLPNGDLWAHRIGWRHNGENWIPQTHDPFGEPFDVLQNADLAIFSVALTPNPAEGGTVSGNGDYQEGSFATISATPNEDFQFVHWKNTENGNVISTQNPYNFQVLENLNIEAVFQNNMSINDTETTKSMVFPNPAKTIINITNPKNGSSELKIFSSAGQLIKSVNFGNEEKITVPVNDLPKGVYVIKAGNVSSKFVKD